MTTFPGSPRLVKGGIVVVDPGTGRLLRVISLQYNPETLTRTLQVQAAGGEARNHSDALRLKGVPVETIRLEAQLDATDHLELPDHHVRSVQLGLHPQIALLESLVYPRSAALLDNDRLAGRGTLEVLPIEAPLTLFVWSKTRVVPVRPTELSVTEEAFDPSLNPIRARVTLGLRVLSVDDLGFAHRGGTAFLSYLRLKESMAAAASTVDLAPVGLTVLP